MILFEQNRCVSICVKNTNKYVRLAVEDMRNDFKKISKSNIFPAYSDEENEYCIVIEKNTIEDGNAVEDESFKISIDKNRAVIAANSYLGTMWGIYTFCEKVLGVDPCYLFNDLETEKKDRLSVENTEISEKPDGFGFRGIFINDEDFLTGWKDGGKIRYIDYSWYGLTVDESVMNMVVETALRLKMNLVIPASFLDIDNYPEKQLADCVAKRGIFLSQHHLEPVGVSGFTFNNYCRKYGKSGEFSYIKNPQTMEEIWAYYADKWAAYDNVVWQIGLRGLVDRPVWEEEVPSDKELNVYGKFISDAYQKQKNIIKKATNGKAKYFTTTLWMEGSQLFEKGLLKFPEEVIIIFADTGLNQMYGKDYFSVPRENGCSYGIYYHVQYFGNGPHLAPQTGIDKLYYHAKLAYDSGDDSYFILNASNIREYVFELGAYSEMMWNINSFSKAEYIQSYCDKFGDYKEKIKELITEYYQLMPYLDTMYLPEHELTKYFNFYLEDNFDGFKNFVLKDGDILLAQGAWLMWVFFKPVNNSHFKLCGEYYKAIKKAVPVYKSIFEEFKEISQHLPEPLKKHLEVKWMLFSKTLFCIYSWFVNLYEAKKQCDLYKSEEMKKHLIAACDSLEKYLNYRKCAEYGIFINWYRGDLKMNIKQYLFGTKRLLGQTPDF